jgi:hypothetical protein
MSSSALPFLSSIGYEDVRQELVGGFDNPDRLPLLTERGLAFLRTHRAIAASFLVMSARTTRAIHLDPRPHGRRDASDAQLRGRWSFVVLYADRDVVESVETVEALERRRNAPALIVLGRGLTPPVAAQ